MRHFNFIIILSMFALSACLEPVEEQINHQIPLTEQQLAQLEQALKNNELPNAQSLQLYAKQLRGRKPEQRNLINLMVANASTQGALYKALEERFLIASKHSDLFENQELRYQELLDIYQAADPKLFSDALSDVVNVLADLSAGELARVNADPKSATLAANKARDFGVVAPLIGNPVFGQWQQNQGQSLTWQWHPEFQALSGYLEIAVIDYPLWMQYRDYSYYADIGRERFTSVFELLKQAREDVRLSEQGTLNPQRQGDSDLTAASLVLKSAYNH